MNSSQETDQMVSFLISVMHPPLYSLSPAILTKGSASSLAADGAAGGGCCCCGWRRCLRKAAESKTWRPLASAT